MTVAIIDYGSGNLHSAAKAFERASRSLPHPEPVLVTRDPERVWRADRVVLPGVGAFADCKKGLDSLDGMVQALTEVVRDKARPFFGICVGMQLMAERGREYVVTEGLGWIAGDVVKIAPGDENLKIPHMGWNTLDPLREHPVLERLPLGDKGRHAYFVHSYHLKAANEADVVARANYGGPVTAIVARDTAIGTQFHPEKSQRFGLALIANFLEVEAVILFPAIDLKNGECVRLEQGDMARATVFNTSPAAQAQAFQAQGFEYLHVVDLDGAFAGRPVNAQAVEAMLKVVSMPLQLGGGIRDMKTVEGWLGKGIARVIIGTAAVRDPDFVKQAAKAFPGRVAVGLDARDGKVAVEGWAKTSQVTALEIAKRFEDAGVAAIIFTDIARDGLLQGLNLDATIALADGVSIPVIASGGLASLDDVRALLAPRAQKLAGAISGRALYDGRLDPVQAIALIKAARSGSAVRASAS